MRRFGYLLATATLRIWNLASPGYLMCLMALLGLFVASLAQGESVAVAPRVLSENTSGQPITQMVPENVTGPSPQPSILEVVYDRATDLLSVHARHAPLAAVLQQISQKAHLSIDSPKTEALAEQVSVDMKGLPLAQALRELVQRFNYAFLYSSPIDPHNKAAAPRLLKVILLSKTASGSSGVHPSKQEPTTESKSVVHREPVVSQSADLIRAIIENNSPLAKDIVDSLKEPEKQEEREKTVEALVETLLERLNNNDLRSYSDALLALKELAPETAARALSHRLPADDRTTRVVAAAGLGFPGDERAIEPLVSALIGSDPWTRQAAASSLARIGGPRAMNGLFQAYLVGDNRIRHPVAVAIASHGDAHSQQALSRLIAAGQAPGEPAAEEEGMKNPNLE